MKVKEAIDKLLNLNPDAEFIVKDYRYDNTYLEASFTEDEYYKAEDESIYFLSQINLEELETKYQSGVLDFVSIVIVQ